VLPKIFQREMDLIGDDEAKVPDFAVHK